MKLGVTLQGLDASLRLLAATSEKITRIQVIALNKIASSVRKEVYAEFTKQFDRPTPTTMRSLFISSASTKQPDPSAAVYVKDTRLGKNAGTEGLNQILGHQFAGGRRIPKRAELAFRARGIIGPDEFLAPGPDIKLDAYGNVSRGQMQQIMANVGAYRDPYQHATGSQRSRRNQARAGNIFWSPGRENGLRRGVWAKGKDGSQPLLLLVVIKPPIYRRRIDMPGIRDRVLASEWQARFDEAVRAVLKK